MEKTCPSHGDFRDIVYSDARLYLKMEQWTFGDNRGLETPSWPTPPVAPMIAACATCTPAIRVSPMWT